VFVDNPFSVEGIQLINLKLLFYQYLKENLAQHLFLPTYPMTSVPFLAFRTDPTPEELSPEY